MAALIISALFVLVLTLFAQLPMGPGARSVITSGGGSNVNLTDTSHNGGDSNICSSSSHDDALPLRTVIAYAGTLTPPVTVTVPPATCYLSSLDPGASGNPANFHLVNNVTVTGTAGQTKLIQTPQGRYTISTQGCTAFTDCFMPGAQFGPFTYAFHCPSTAYPLAVAPTPGNNYITLATPSNASNFPAGSYVGWYESNNPCSLDTQPAEYQKVINNDPVLGRVYVRHPVEEPMYAVGVAYNITAQAVHDIGLSNLEIDSAAGPAMNNVFDMTISNVHFLIQYQAKDPSGATGFNPVFQMNGVEDSTWNGVTVDCDSDCSAWSTEGFQRQSGHLLINNFTFGNAANPKFGMVGFSFSEWPRSITIQNSTFYCGGENTGGFCLAALSVNGVINNNTFNVNGNYGGTNGGIVTEGMGSGSNVAALYSGNFQITNNTINGCRSDAGNACIFYIVSDTHVSGNKITVAAGSNPYGIQMYSGATNPCCGGVANSFQINNNNPIATNGSSAIFLGPGSNGGWQINGNVISSTGGGTGINVYTNPGGGSCFIQNNGPTTGFTTKISNSDAVCTTGGNSYLRPPKISDYFVAATFRLK